MWYREHSNRIHMKKLKDINSRNFSIEPSTTRFHSVSKRKNKFMQNEVTRQNVMLYNKLTKISERIQNKNQIKGPKSLNISIRKKEADRIIQGNFEFVKRLTEKESMFSIKKLRKEIDMQEKYKNTISRHNLHERLKKITDTELKLPPINQEYTKGASTSRISNISKLSKTEIPPDEDQSPKPKNSPDQSPSKKFQTIQSKPKKSAPCSPTSPVPCEPMAPLTPPSAKESENPSSILPEATPVPAPVPVPAPAPGPQADSSSSVNLNPNPPASIPSE